MAIVRSYRSSYRRTDDGCIEISISACDRDETGKPLDVSKDILCIVKARDNAEIRRMLKNAESVIEDE